MREILFRGQTRKKGEKVRLDGSPIDSNWVYGGIFPNNEGGDFAIIYQQYPKIEKYTVYVDTVGQFTGLTDKNGRKIFEGDILKIVHKYQSPFDDDTKEYTDITTDVVFFDDEGLCFSYGESPFLCVADNVTAEYEVVGNIHDNPELLEQEG